MRVAILTPRLDDRAGAGTVASRIGLRAQGLAFSRDANLQQVVEDDIRDNGPLHCVLVDEAQFLSKPQGWQLSEVAVSYTHLDVYKRQGWCCGARLFARHRPPGRHRRAGVQRRAVRR